MGHTCAELQKALYEDAYFESYRQLRSKRKSSLVKGGLDQNNRVNRNEVFEMKGYRLILFGVLTTEVNLRNFSE